MEGKFHRCWESGNTKASGRHASIAVVRYLSTTCIAHQEWGLLKINSTKHSDSQDHKKVIFGPVYSKRHVEPEHARRAMPGVPLSGSVAAFLAAIHKATVSSLLHREPLRCKEMKYRIHWCGSQCWLKSFMTHRRYTLLYQLHRGLSWISQGTCPIMRASTLRGTPQ